MKTTIIAVIISCCFGATAGTVEDFYFWQKDANRPSTNSRPYSDIRSLDHGITQIGIERTECYGSCPKYTLIVKSDGSFRYRGEKYVERKGDYTGTVDLGQFNQLARFIKESKFMELDSTYTANITDNPTVYTMVVMNGKRKVISNYANTAPMKVWAIEELIDGLLTTAKWNPTKSKTK